MQGAAAAGVAAHAARRRTRTCGLADTTGADDYDTILSHIEYTRSTSEDRACDARVCEVVVGVGREGTSTRATAATVVVLGLNERGCVPTRRARAAFVDACGAGGGEVGGVVGGAEVDDGRMDGEQQQQRRGPTAAAEQRVS